MSEFDISKETLEQEYLINKKTWREIGKELNVSDSMLLYLAKQYNIKSRSISEIKRNCDDFQIQEIIEYYKAGWQCTKIAKKYNITYSCVYQILKNSGIVLREPKVGGSKLFGRWKWDNKKWLQEAYINASTKQISKHVGCSINVIRTALLYYQIPFRENKGPLNYNHNPIFLEYSLIDKDEFIKLNQQLTDNELMIHYERSLASIASLRIEFNIIKQNKSIIKIKSFKALSIASKTKWLKGEFRNKVIQGNKEKWNNDDYRYRMAVRRAEQGNRDGPSKPQIRLYELLDEIGVNYYKEGKETVLSKYPLDVLIPNYINGRHLLIEMQSYWHTLEKQQNRDRKKFHFISKYYPNYDLLYVWEHELHNIELIKEKLLLKLRPELLSTIDFEFQSLKIKDATVIETQSFIDAYHYIGSSRYGRSIAAYYNDEIVAMVVYAAPVRQNLAKRYNCENNELLELARFAINPKYRKKNLASWFLSKTLKLLQCKVVVAFSDLTVGHIGTIYKATNFVFDHKTTPDYWYMDENNRVYKKKSIYNKAKILSITEREYVEINHLLKIYGAEKLAFVWRFK